MNSYLAHFARANARRLEASLWRGYAWLAEYLRPVGRKVVRQDTPRRRDLHLPRQYGWFARRAAPGVLFLRVGSHFELMDGQARRFAPPLGLRRIAPRPGFRRRAGFHRRYLARFVARALRLGIPVTVVTQKAGSPARTRERRVAVRFLPPAAVATGEEVRT